ncbi:N-acetylmuramoyl-L-alanine amidase [Peribacillus asahii]|uniref:N-acetylmuramoyl-L-alanine amidase n=1 Tax=Peribacillus asahii TaxID=228899 RepID=A0A3T0KSP5_9BACI|nr:N-acetylmuramoyl-L-alanine amidase [Peribacillus asahii]AZV43224.1 N-acetylmuramoyl-L-alanine amidase [Peribacillus asahii]USK83305.1 N-acetylmuramoyl-L-alanine amidase [Peribacillus asahii]
MFGGCLPQQKNLQVLRTTNMLALLTESLCISNPNEAAILKKVAFIEDIAQGHVNGSVKCFSLKKKKVDENQYHTVIKGDTVPKLAKEYGSKPKAGTNLMMTIPLRLARSCV